MPDSDSLFHEALPLTNKTPVATRTHSRHGGLDDLAARELAASNRLLFTGTLGCLAQAKAQGIIPDIKPLLQELRTKSRFWISDAPGKSYFARRWRALASDQRFKDRLPDFAPQEIKKPQKKAFQLPLWPLLLSYLLR